MKKRIESGMISGIMTGVIVWMVITTVMISLFAWLIISGVIPEDKIPYANTGMLLFGSLVSTAVAISKVNQKYQTVALSTAAAIVLVMLSVNALLFEGVYEGVAVTSLCVAAGSLCAFMLKTKGKRSVKRRGIKR